MDRNYQVLFLEHARSRMPQRIQWAEELAELLNIGIDSAYRRIRGETALTFNEAVVVSRSTTFRWTTFLKRATNASNLMRATRFAH